MRYAEPIHLIGAGTIGTQVAKRLAEWHIPSELHAWDGDKVEPGNIGPQTYRKQHLGVQKVTALQQQIGEWNSDIRYVPHNQYIEGWVSLSGIVFLGLDSMDERRAIWDSSIKQNRQVSLMIETRLDAKDAYLFVIDPNNEKQAAYWEHYCNSGQESTTVGMSCGAVTSSVGPIAELAAGLCIWQLIRYLEIKAGASDVLHNRIDIEMIPFAITAYRA